MTQLIVTDHGGGRIEFSSGWRQWPLPRPVAPASERRIRFCQWCGGRYRQDPGPDTDGQRWCSDGCATDHHLLEEDSE